MKRLKNLIVAVGILLCWMLCAMVFGTKLGVWWGLGIPTALLLAALGAHAAVNYKPLTPEQREHARAVFAAAQGKPPADGSAYIVRTRKATLTLSCAGILLFALAMLTLPTVIVPLICFLLLWPISATIKKRQDHVECSECGTTLAHNRIKVCPACGARFQPKDLPGGWTGTVTLK